jgi:hypothetical protein
VLAVAGSVVFMLNSSAEVPSNVEVARVKTATVRIDSLASRRHRAMLQTLVLRVFATRELR